MSDIVISVEDLSKSYQLGTIGSGTFRGDIESWWAKVRGLPDPHLKIGDAASKYHREVLWALKDINFKVRQGEAVGIIGRNGAGKSTLLKILSRITAPTTGFIGAKGRLASLLEVGTGFHPELTGRENIYLNGAIMGMTRKEVAKRFDEIVDFSGVEKFIDTPVKRYSSGMYVRLAFAVSAHLEPDIMIVDEVLAVGDVEFQKKCMGKMDEVANAGRTVLFVSHNMASIQNLCSRAILLSQGEIVMSGDTDTVISKYLEDTQKIASQNLGERKDRSGTQRLKFTRFSLEDQDGNEVRDMASGKDYAMVLDYESDDTVENVTVSIAFHGVHGQILSYCNNDMAGFHFPTLPQTGKIKCLLPRLPFPQGSYTLNFYCEVNGITSDWVKDAAVVEVAGGDFFESGRLPPLNHGGLLIPQKWSVT